MNERVAALIESHPGLAWLASLGSVVLGWLSWFFEHVDDFAKAFGLAAALFGAIAGYYTMRIQRRAWQHRRGRSDNRAAMLRK